MYTRTKEDYSLDIMSQEERNTALTSIGEKLSDSLHTLRTKFIQNPVSLEEANNYISISYRMWTNAMILQASQALQYELGVSLVQRCIPLHEVVNETNSVLLFKEINKSDLDFMDKDAVIREIYDRLNDGYNKSISL